MESLKMVLGVKNGKNSGSALVIVLGVLSVLMLMSVAFSTFMRTERGATTNFKNAHVAEQTLHSALALAIQAIDDSLSEATNGYGAAVLDSPAVVWPQPWLASCSPDDRGIAADDKNSSRDRSRLNDGYFQSRVRGDLDGELVRDDFDPQTKASDPFAPSPNVLCSGAAEFLTSNQLAMIRSAAVDWAPIYSGIGAGKIPEEDNDEEQRVFNQARVDYYKSGDAEPQGGVNAGYPRKLYESIVGRYAFVALDTTGYLDIGKIGDFDLAARKDSDGGNPWLFIPPDAKAKTPGGTEIPSPLVSGSRKKLGSALSSQKALLSQYDAKSSGNFPFEAKTVKDAKNFMPPDLYAGTGVSLESLTPEGEPKVVLPYGDDGKNLSDSDREDLALRVYRAMIAVFARSRKEGGVSEWWKEQADQRYRDNIHLYEGAGGLLDLYVPKAALATVGVMDAIDGDSAPGKKSGKADSDSYWAVLAAAGDKNDGEMEVKLWDDSRKPSDHSSGDFMRTVKTGISGVSAENPLNYPCTAGAPLVKTFYAYVTIDQGSRKEVPIPDDAVEKPDPHWQKVGIPASNYLWRVEYNASLHVGAIAADDNRDDSDGSHNLSTDLEVTFDVMAENAKSGTVSGGSMVSGNVRNNFVEFRRDPSSGYAPEIEWNGVWLQGETLNGSATVSESVGSDGTRFVNVSKSYPFTIKCGVQSVDPVNSTRTYFPLTQNEWKYKENSNSYGTGDNDAHADVWLPIRFKAEVKVGGKTVQQVPAPRLATDNKKDWWVRVDAGVYHDKDDSVVKGTAGNGTHNSVDGSSGALAQGWAECLAPQFGMDTTCLSTDGSDEPTWDSHLKFWVNNVLARKGYTAAALGSSAKMIFSKLSKDLDPSDSLEYDNNGETALDVMGLFTGGSLRPSVTDWLFDDSESDWEDLDDGLWAGWFNEYDSSCADLMHQISRSANDVGDRDWLVGDKFGSGDAGWTAARLYNELYTRFRTDGLKSVGDLGSVMIGPYETLSLFKTWRSPPYIDEEPDSDFHPVFDYFTMAEDRYPKSDDCAGELQDDGGVDWNGLGTFSSSPKQRHLFSAVQNGRVNLNLPRLLDPFDYSESGKKIYRVRRSRHFNPYPLATALVGAPWPGIKNDKRELFGVSDEAAVEMAAAYASMLENADVHPGDSEYRASTVTPTVTNIVEMAGARKKGFVASDEWSNKSISSLHVPAVRDVSFFASAGGATSNAVLRAFLEGTKKGIGNGTQDQRGNLCDYTREGVLRGVSEAFTTRGQSFLLVLRADAYTARFGKQEDPRDGTALASAHALVELFRDPEPARLPDGTFPRDADGNPVLYHNWFIRSFRMF